jgi:hypothetical protein
MRAPEGGEPEGGEGDGHGEGEDGFGGIAPGEGSAKAEDDGGGEELTLPVLPATGEVAGLMELLEERRQPGKPEEGGQEHGADPGQEKTAVYPPYHQAGGMGQGQDEGVVVSEAGEVDGEGIEEPIDRATVIEPTEQEKRTDDDEQLLKGIGAGFIGELNGQGGDGQEHGGKEAAGGSSQR